MDERGAMFHMCYLPLGVCMKDQLLGGLSLIIVVHL